MILFYLLYSGFGMIAFAAAVRPMKRLLVRRGAPVWLWGLPFFAIVSLGVYLGLVLRLNSWDVVTHPSLVWNSIVELGNRPWLAIFIGAFGLFLWIGYELVEIWIDGFLDRATEITGRTCT